MATSKGPPVFDTSSATVPSPCGFAGRFFAGLAAMLASPSLLHFENAGLKILRNVGQHFAPVGGDEDVVFDADAAYAGQIDAWLDGEDHAGREYRVDRGPEERRFMHREAQAVAGAVREEVAVAGIGDDAAGGGVDVAGLDPRPHRRDR